MTYICYGCNVAHSTENMVAYCAVCFSNEKVKNEKLSAVVEAVKGYLSECPPHPRPDYALRAGYLIDLRKALAALEER